jgi:hypothetical protein
MPGGLGHSHCSIGPVVSRFEVTSASGGWAQASGGWAQLGVASGEAGALLTAAAHAAHVASSAGDTQCIGDASRGPPADGTKMSHVVVASVAMVSISHNSRGAAGARPGPGSYFAARGGYVRTEGLGDLPLAQYGAFNTITQAFSATLLRQARSRAVGRGRCCHGSPGC